MLEKAEKYSTTRSKKRATEIVAKFLQFWENTETGFRKPENPKRGLAVSLLWSALFFVGYHSSTLSQGNRHYEHFIIHIETNSSGILECRSFGLHFYYRFVVTIDIEAVNGILQLIHH